jgi:rSAM/selenodomain-associated transferase 1
VFAKPPVPGSTKTRLAAEIGDDAAAALAQAMLRDVWQAVCAVEGVMPLLAVSQAGAFPDPISDATMWPQGKGDLGARLERIFRRGLGQFATVLAVGSDVPHLTPAHIKDAVLMLDRNDAVLGPSPDGGYYLLGLKQCPKGLLSDLPWSCCDTLRTTEDRLRSRGFSIGIVQSLSDIDVAADLNVLRSVECGPATRAWMEAHG